MEQLEEKFNEIIDGVVKALDLDKNKAIIKMTETEDENKRIFELKNGNWNSEDIWFCIDEKDKTHPMIPFETVKGLAISLGKAKQDNLRLELEKAILQYIPVDYEDVLSVVRERIRDLMKEDKSFHKTIDFSKVVESVKYDFPNLFMNIEDKIFKMGFSKND